MTERRTSGDRKKIQVAERNESSGGQRKSKSDQKKVQVTERNKSSGD